MPVQVTLLRPFVFSRPAHAGNRMPSEVRYTPLRKGAHGWEPTTIELPDDVANNPWVKDDFADGAIESPAQAAARLKELTKAQVANDAEAARINAAAEQAMARATGGAVVAGAASAATEKELNTPVNELGAAQGKDIDAPPAAPAQPSEADLNTPVNELQAKTVGVATAAAEAPAPVEPVAAPAAVPAPTNLLSNSEEMVPGPAGSRPTLKRK